jgi:hypothetical protein
VCERGLLIAVNESAAQQLLLFSLQQKKKKKKKKKQQQQLSLFLSALQRTATAMAALAYTRASY